VSKLEGFDTADRQPIVVEKSLQNTIPMKKIIRKIAGDTDSVGSHETTKLGNFQHDRNIEHGKEEWLTPPTIIDTFGPFDLDPCAPVKRPWATATNHFTIEDDGLARPWHGLVWCNPPYGPKTGDWLAKCVAHNNCLALVFARTDTQWFQNHVWPHATSLFFITGRLSFYHVGGEKGGTAGAPSVLIAYGDLADQRLRENVTISGKYLQNLPNNIFLGSA
jgi:hypothetical protein